jgi:UDP-galactopyranose mutase
LHAELASADLVIVGSGFFGATIAERCATALGLKVAVLERRSHVGGNAWSEDDPDTGIEVHVYGSHLFHTSNEKVWTYINKFSEFSNYRHRVIVRHANAFYTMPMNLGTLSTLFGKFLDPITARTLIAEEVAASGIKDPTNLEEKAISLVGKTMYEAFIRHYTTKQWQTDPRELPPDVIARLPVRLTFDDHYFDDKFEGLPLVGYGEVFRRMLAHERISIHTGADFFDLRSEIPTRTPVIFTGAIDRYFDYRAGRLGWRTIDFEREIIPTGDFQGTSVVNYPDPDVSFTRIHEFRHLHPERRYPSDKTVIFREYSRFAEAYEEPFYPIATKSDKTTYQVYRELSDREPNVIFGGRLGTYRYLDMHQAISAALHVFENRLLPHFTKSAPLNAGPD